MPLDISDAIIHPAHTLSCIEKYQTLQETVRTQNRPHFCKQTPCIALYAAKSQKFKNYNTAFL